MRLGPKLKIGEKIRAESNFQMSYRQLFRFPIFLKTLNWRDGTGDNSSGNWSLHEFFSPIFSLGPSRIQRCIVLPEPTKTRISPS
eukprot:COSAG02_NODE_49442_length_326_cov_21.757709_1_plen_84_part_10